MWIKQFILWLKESFHRNEITWNRRHIHTARESWGGGREKRREHGEITQIICICFCCCGSLIVNYLLHSARFKHKTYIMDDAKTSKRGKRVRFQFCDVLVCNTNFLKWSVDKKNWIGTDPNQFPKKPSQHTLTHTYLNINTNSSRMLLMVCLTIFGDVDFKIMGILYGFLKRRCSMKVIRVMLRYFEFSSWKSVCFYHHINCFVAQLIPEWVSMIENENIDSIKKNAMALLIPIHFPSISCQYS